MIDELLYKVPICYAMQLLVEGIRHSAVAGSVHSTSVLLLWAVPALDKYSDIALNEACRAKCIGTV